MADEILVLPIDCGDQVADLEGRPLPDNGPGRGAARLRALQDLVQTRCTIQDVDYAYVGAVEDDWVMEGIQARKVSLKNRHEGKQSVRYIGVCTFRRPHKG